MTTEDKINLLQCRIKQKQARLNAGIITNSKIVKRAKKQIQRWRQEIEDLTTIE